MLSRILDWDRELFLFLNSLGNKAYDAFWISATDGFNWVPLFIVFLYLLFKTFPTKEAVGMTLNAIVLLFVVLLVTLAAKQGFARLRPIHAPHLQTLVRNLVQSDGYSFFSGHASSSFSLTTLMFLYLRTSFRWSYLFFIWPFVFAFSRIYVGVHYPVDILTGSLVGVLAGLLFHRGYVDIIVPYMRLDRRE
jgi:undecaprenyl-diphosphatase